MASQPGPGQEGRARVICLLMGTAVQLLSVDADDTKPPSSKARLKGTVALKLPQLPPTVHTQITSPSCASGGPQEDPLPCGLFCLLSCAPQSCCSPAGLGFCPPSLPFPSRNSTAGAGLP